MEIIAHLFLNPLPPSRFEIGEGQIVHTPPPTRHGMILRLYCKELNLDESLPVFLSALPDEDEQQNIRDTVESYRLLSFLSGKRVLLRVRKFFTLDKDPSPADSALSLLLSSFRYAGGQPIDGAIALNDRALEFLYTLLGQPVPTAAFPRVVSGLRRAIYRKVRIPPPNFPKLLLALPEPELQLLLNAFLHKNIATTDMLAAYIRSLDDAGLRLLDNLSSAVRTEVREKIRRDRMTATYRWMDEVYYIINRNIMILAGELGVTIRGLEILSHIRFSYDVQTLLDNLSRKRVEDWLDELRALDGGLNQLFQSLRRPDLNLALGFIPEESVRYFFSRLVSAQGIRLLLEDREHGLTRLPEERYQGLLNFFHAVKDLTYAPRVEVTPFEDTVRELVAHGEAVDLIVDEIGFAPAVFALKSLPPEWTDTVLSGTFRHIYEDTLSRKLIIKGYDDYLAEQCRREFLKAVLILSDEEKI